MCPEYVNTKIGRLCSRPKSKACRSPDTQPTFSNPLSAAFGRTWAMRRSVHFTRNESATGVAPRTKLPPQASQPIATRPSLIFGNIPAPCKKLLPGITALRNLTKSPSPIIPQPPREHNHNTYRAVRLDLGGVGQLSRRGNLSNKSCRYRHVS